MIAEEITAEGQYAQEIAGKDSKPKKGRHKEKHPKHDAEKAKEQIWHAS